MVVEGERSCRLHMTGPTLGGRVAESTPSPGSGMEAWGPQLSPLLQDTGSWQLHDCTRPLSLSGSRCRIHVRGWKLVMCVSQSHPFLSFSPWSLIALSGDPKPHPSLAFLLHLPPLLLPAWMYLFSRTQKDRKTPSDSILCDTGYCWKWSACWTCQLQP